MNGAALELESLEGKGTSEGSFKGSSSKKFGNQKKQTKKKQNKRKASRRRVSTNGAKKSAQKSTEADSIGNGWVKGDSEVEKKNDDFWFFFATAAVGWLRATHRANEEQLAG